MSRRVAPILKDVTPPWTLGPVSHGGKKQQARAAQARRDTTPPSVRLDPACPPEFIRTCLPPVVRVVAVAVPARTNAERRVVKTSGSGLVAHYQTSGVILPLPRPGSRRHQSWVYQMGRCYYCTWLTPLEKWTLDHKLARAKGGTNQFGNLAGCCWTCNHAKRTMSSEDFLATEYVRRRREVRPE